MLHAHARQAMSEMKVIEDFAGVIDVTHGNWIYREHFFLGDIVTIQDNDIGAYKNVRIGEITEYQDQDGYSVEATLQGE